MVRSFFVRLFLVVVICAALGGLPAVAAEPHAATQAGPAQAPWYGWFLEALAFLTGENGCRPDPYGGCGAAVVQVDNGCVPDPSGGCGAAVVQVDNGCLPDPNGGCGDAVVQVDNGCRMDPYGGCRE
jgi:hypothetical protein